MKEELVVVVGDMSVSPPSPRRRPLPPSVVPPPPKLDLHPLLKSETKVGNQSFRKSSSTGDNTIQFKILWEEETQSKRVSPRRSQTPRSRSKRKTASLTRADSMMLSDFPCRVLKIFDARTGHSLFESDPRHVNIEASWFSGSIHYPSGPSNLNLRLDIWAESIPSSFRKQGDSTKKASDAKEKKTRTKKIRLVGSRTVSLQEMSAVLPEDPIFVTEGHDDDHDEYQRYNDLVLTSPKTARASARARKRKTMGRISVHKWTIIKRGVRGERPKGTSRRRTSQHTPMSSPSKSRGIRGFFRGISSKQRRASPKFTTCPKEQMIGSEHFYSLGGLQRRLQNATSRAEFCKHLANAQRLITNNVPLHITHLSSANECLGDLKRFAVEVNGKTQRDHIKSATRRAAFVSFCSVIEDYLRGPLNTLEIDDYFADEPRSPTSPSAPLHLVHQHNSAPARAPPGSLRRRMSLRSITYRRRASKSIPRSAPIISWIVQNINENRIGDCVQKAILKVLGIDYEKSVNFILYDLSNQKDIKKEISKVTIEKKSVVVEKVIHYELNNHEHEFKLMIHVKSIARLSLATGKEVIRFEMGFDHDEDQLEYAGNSHDDVLTLHSADVEIPKSELVHIYAKCLGISIVPESVAGRVSRGRRVSSLGVTPLLTSMATSPV